MKFEPLLPLFVIIPILGVLLLVAVFAVLRSSRKIGAKIFGVIRMVLIIALIFGIIVRPMKRTYGADVELKNIDVLIVMDSTISMWAEDYNGKETRNSGAMAMTKKIIDDLAGSNFALISFNNRSQVLAPFTQDATNVLDALDTIKQPNAYYARGTSLNAPVKDMMSLLLSSSKKEKRLTVVFYLTDGEITDQSKLEGYGELKNYIDMGAVIGFGTQSGGKMHHIEEDYAPNDYLEDPETNEPALSRIDEDNLNTLANDLGVKYINAADQSKVQVLVDSIKDGSGISLEQVNEPTYEDVYFWLLAPLGVLLIMELVSGIRRKRL